MKIVRNGVVLFFLIMGFTAYGQDNCNYKSMIAKIDSISKAENIEIGKVKILYVTNQFDHTQTEKKSLTDKSKFHFDGQFLVIENKYFNINKLLYFYVDDGVIEFFFQGY
ncbi:hypothetical protein DMA11_16080 [Marinilabiliaceae bacterium JC017]|nr:hypothetical protein DMA11_16080 [Marinilabiliaceae bacterium JC017]